MSVFDRHWYFLSIMPETPAAATIGQPQDSMATPSSLASPLGPHIVAGVLFGAGIYLFLPGQVVAVSDDFGYLRSAIETIHRARPWTDDWLEPWSASFSLIAAFLYKTTGSFHFATYGLLAVAAATAFSLAAILFRQRGLTDPAAIVCAALVMTFPTSLVKSTDFTGVALYLPCLLGAILAARHGRWGLFAAIWLLAIATRQSAVTWLVLPAVEALRVVHQAGVARRRAFVRVAVLGAAGALVYLVLHAVMNKTHAQTVVFDHLLERFSLRTALNTGWVGVITFAVCAGLGACATALRTRPDFRANLRNPVMPVACLLFASLLLVSDWRGWVRMEHTLFFGTSGWLYSKFVIVLALVGWLTTPRLDWKMAVCGFGCLLPLLLRADLWDYYLLEIAIFGLFAVLPAKVAPEQLRAPPDIKWGLAVTAMMMVLSVLQISTTIRLKVAMDRATALCLIHETALRAGKLHITEIAHAPFGLIGWHLFPYYAKHEGRVQPRLSGFLRYLTDTVEVQATSNMPFWGGIALNDDRSSSPRTLIAQERHRLCWFYTAEFTIYRTASSPGSRTPALPFFDREYSPGRFPLSEAEWRQLADR